MFSQLVSANPKGANTTGMNHIGVSPLLIPQGQLRIYLGAAHRFIWPVHLAGWLELGWTTEPGATPGATAGTNGPGATPVATRTPSKTRRSNKEKNPIGVNHIEVSPLLIPQGQLRIYLGAAHRFIWPVHLAGWLELGWTTEPGATPGVTAVATAPVKPKKRKTPTEPNPTNESPVGANPIGVSPIDGSPLGVGSAKEVDPLPVLVTDFLVDPSVPTND